VSDESITVYKVTRPDYGKQFCIYQSWTDVASEFDGADWGDIIHVEIARMTPAELDALPDFEGW
jgi:hypothetical protein